MNLILGLLNLLLSAIIVLKQSVMITEDPNVLFAANHFILNVRDLRSVIIATLLSQYLGEFVPAVYPKFLVILLLKYSTYLLTIQSTILEKTRTRMLTLYQRTVIPG